MKTSNVLKGKKIRDMKTAGTREWAATTKNILTGCEHDCKYCYAKEMAIRFNRAKVHNWNYENLRRHSIKNCYRKKNNGQIMYPSSHDITPKFLQYHIDELRKMLEGGNEVLMVSKPHYECIQRICAELSEFKNQILFRFSIGSADSGVLKFWEPNAPSFDERIECLKLAYSNGFRTSVSCEPMLDSQVGTVIFAVHPYVNDKIWIGKANDLMKRLKINGHTDNKTLFEANKLIQWQSDDSNVISLYHQFKDDPKIMWKDSISKMLKNYNLSTNL